ncbi:MAG TPA: T9SS type A sorting domain-containing protein [Ignavibacteriaceae bacterium]|nr:T9SS type A sorting domain-containing protein [Ignavibacteriaceae bacterium]
MKIFLQLAAFTIFGFLVYNNLFQTGKHSEPRDEFPSDWFYRQRAYPTGDIPLNKYYAAIEKKNQLKNAPGRILNNSWLPEGPVNIGGRISDIEMSSTSYDTIYAGIASGGVFKSVNGGSSWVPVFDETGVMSIGDLAVDPVNPNVVYAGTGEVNCGGGSMTYGGNGVYKSIDGGQTWTLLGLAATQYISRIIIDPNNSNTIYLGAMGRLFAKNQERGLYKSTDGGITWQKKLYVSDSTGCVDIAINPQQTNIIYAAMWERTRRPDRHSYGGPTCGIYKSTDGGETWNELTNGIPHNSSTIGRIGISLSASSPNILYAIYADDVGYFTGVYKSTNGGDSWVRTNDGALNGFYSSYGWWFGNIRVDPDNPSKVFVMGLDVYRTTDGGNSWNYSSGSMHVDQHAMYIYPSNSNFIIAGNDGGVYKSTNGGSTWTFISQMPITQFYTCEVDYQYPFRLYGGSQDNSVMRTMTGNTNDYQIILGGDGFYVLVDYQNNNYIYAEYQYGALNRSTNGGSSFMDATNGISYSDRSNWCSPIVMDPNNPAILYFGTNHVYKTTNHAANWTSISPDLSNGTPSGNLVYGTVTTIAVSKSDPNVIYAGTDDGNIWVTLNGGTSWTKISDSLPGFWVTRVAIDPNDPMIAYATLSGYRNDEYLPHIFRTSDAGSSWTDISSNIPEAPVNDIIVDPDNTNILYAASDVGVFYSLNNGGNWQYLGDSLPDAPVTDIILHNPTRTLVTATYGRSFYSIDISNIVPVELTSFTGKTLNGQVILNWTTSTETNNRGFEIQRKIENSNWETIGFKEGRGTTTKPQLYSFADDNLQPGEYLYRLKQVDFDGNYKCSEVVKIEISVSKFSLSQNYPNPFNPVTTIVYQIPDKESVTLKVYDALGNEVATLVNEEKPAGNYAIKFDANKLSSGVYFYKLKSGSFTATKKLILMK